MDQSLISVMKSIGNALQLDSASNYDEAYIKYAECVLCIVSNLLHKIKTDGGKVVVSKEVVRHIQLGQQCMDRLGALVQSIVSKQNRAATLSQQSQVSSKMAAQGQGHNLQMAKRFSDPVPPLQPDTSPYSFSRKHGLSPMELAYIRNQQLMTAYKSRLARMNKGSQATLSLTIQRKMAENLAIAKAQEEALSKKMNERQNRLEEQAQRRFSAPMGMSEDEQEQRLIYKKILEYEQDAKWLTEWRLKLESSPEDPIVINQLIQEILRCSDHPLTQLLKKYQYKIYERLYPLVSNKLKQLKDITVPLPSYLYPPGTETKQSENISGRESEEQTDTTGRESEEQTDTTGRETEEQTKISGRETEEQTKISRAELEEEENERRQLDEGRAIKPDAESTRSDKIDSDVVNDNGFSEQMSESVKKENNNGSPRNSLSQDDDEDELSNIIKEVVNSDVDDENDSNEDEASFKNMDDFVRESKQNIVSAMVKGKKLEKQLTIENEKAKAVLGQITEYDKYNEENMDDLFDDEDEMDFMSNEALSGLKDQPHTTYQPRSFNSLPAMTKPSFESTKRSSSLPHDESFSGKFSSSEDSPSSGSIPKSVSMDSGTSLPSGNSSLRPSQSLESVHDANISKLSEEAYQRHLTGISHDIHGYLEKLLLMFVIAYEKLDSPIGRDQCYALLEEPFFKPIWKYILALFRLVNRTREKTLAYKMTMNRDSKPQDSSISKKLWLVSSKDKNKIPYRKAIVELQKVKEYYTMLSKLECIVRVCREVCACVEDYYTSGESESGRKTPPSVGADDLLPILSYIIMKSELPQLVSECQAMSEFIHEGYIMGEEGYCLTSLQTAINFLTSEDGCI